MNTFLDKRLINLYSANGIKQNSSSNSSIQFEFSNLLNETDLAYAEIGIVNAEIPVSFYTINENNNALWLEYQEVGQPLITVHKMIIPVGNYTATNFISTFIEVLKDTIAFPFPIGAVFLMNIIRSTGKLTMFVQPTSISLLKFRRNDVLDPNDLSTMYDLVGFDGDEYIVSEVFEKVLPHPLNLLGTNKLTIKSNNLSTLNYNSGTQGFSNILTTVEVDEAPFGIILYKNTSLTYNILRVKHLNIFTIDIVDEKGSFVNFNNQNWTITLGLNMYRYTPVNSNTTFRDMLMKPPIVDEPKEPKEPKDVTLTKKSKDLGKKEKEPIKNDLDLLTYQ